MKLVRNTQNQPENGLPVTSHTAPSTTSPVKILDVVSLCSTFRYQDSREGPVWNNRFDGSVQALLQSERRITSMLSLTLISFFTFSFLYHLHMVPPDSSCSQAHQQQCKVYSKYFLYNCNLRQSHNSDQREYQRYEQLGLGIVHWELDEWYLVWHSWRQCRIQCQAIGKARRR
jgi:hypothetical protein